MPRRVSGSGTTPVTGRWNVSAGCDVDKNYVVVGVYDVNETEIITREFAQTQVGASAAIEWLIERGVQVVVIESTANYHMLFFDAISKAGLRIHVINPLIVKSLLRVEGKSDKGDAATLARLAASFDLRVSNMPDDTQREIRLILRDLDALKGQRTRLTNRVGSALTAAGCTIFRLIKLATPSGLVIAENIAKGLPPTEILAKWRPKTPGKKEAALASLAIVPEYVRNWLTEQVFEVRRLSAKIDAQEAYALTLIERFGLSIQVAMMCTAPAVSPLVALRIIAEMGQNYWQRYHSADAFAKAVGVVPSNEVSGGKLLKRKSTHGNIYVKRHLLNSVKSWVIRPGDHELKQFYINYRRRATYGKAVSAIARRIIEALWWMGTKGDVYRDKKSIHNNTPPPTMILLVVLHEAPVLKLPQMPNLPPRKMTLPLNKRRQDVER